MDNELQAQLKTRIQELPLDVRQAILSVDFGRKVQAIGARHQLHIDQIGTLEDEVLLVMLAFSEADEFVPNLVEQLHISIDVANLLADEVSHDILTPIRHSMQEFMEERVAKNVHAALTESLSKTPSTHNTSLTKAPHTATIIPVMPLDHTFTAPTYVPRPLMPPTGPSFSAADAMLTGKTLMPPITPMPLTPFTTASTPPTTPAQPQRDYKTDPYHEPVG